MDLPIHLFFYFFNLHVFAKNPPGFLTQFGKIQAKQKNNQFDINQPYWMNLQTFHAPVSLKNWLKI